MVLMFGASAIAVLVAASYQHARALGGEGSPLTDTYVSTYEIVQEFPHDGNAFTQGLVFDDDGHLYESDGLFGKSVVRKVDVLTGTSTHKTANEHHHFAEGIEVIGDKLVQLTWKNHMINEYALSDLRHIRSIPNPVGREGWGLASDGERLYLSDSTDALFHLNLTT